MRDELDGGVGIVDMSDGETTACLLSAYRGGGLSESASLGPWQGHGGMSRRWSFLALNWRLLHFLYDRWRWCFWGAAGWCVRP
jgi:hypothetical protein